MIETLALGYSSESTQRELSNEYQFTLWMKVASALEGVVTSKHLSESESSLEMDDERYTTWS